MRWSGWAASHLALGARSADERPTSLAPSPLGAEVLSPRREDQIRPKALRHQARRERVSRYRPYWRQWRRDKSHPKTPDKTR